MTLATERTKVGRRPCTIVECDMDTCSKTFNTGEDSDTVASYYDNLVRYSEELDQWTEVTPATITLTEYTTSYPSPTTVSEAWTVDDDGTGANRHIKIALEAGVLTDNAQYMLQVYVREDTASGCTIALYDNDAATARTQIDFDWTVLGSSLQVKANDVGTGSVTLLSGGWARAEALVPASVIVAANAHEVRLYPTENGVTEAAGTVFAGCALYAGTSALEYQTNDDRSGTYTCVSLVTGGIGLNDYQGGKALIDGTNIYDVERNGTGYIRVSGNPQALGTGVTVELSDSNNSGCLIGNEDACFNTLTTCRNTDYLDISTTQTYRWCGNELTSKEVASIDAVACLEGVDIGSPRLNIGEGLGTRGTANIVLRDGPHHDRGVDPYVSTRSYVPESQGTYFRKFLFRNKFYQNRPLRVYRGYAEADGISIANDFAERLYLIDRISGPDPSGKVNITAKDVIKLADNNRAQIPETSSGFLDGDITDGDTTITIDSTLSGNPTTEYNPPVVSAGSESGSIIRIGSEVITYTGTTANTFTGCQRGQYGTTAAAHSDGDAVQRCSLWEDVTLDDLVWEALVYYAGINSGYITLANWTSETDTWLGGCTVSGVLTEPMSVADFLNNEESGILALFLIGLYWDDVAQKIELEVLAPSVTSYSTITDDDIVANSFSISEDPSKRLSRVVVHYDPSDVTELADKKDYAVAAGIIDADAETSDEYGEQRIRSYLSPYYTNAGPAIRLVNLIKARYRNNVVTYTWEMDAAQDWDLGDVIEINSAYIVDEFGANNPTLVRITSIEEPQPGHRYRYMAEKYEFEERVMRVADNAAGDYSAATAAQKLIWGWFCENSEPYLNGDGAYTFA